MGIMVGPAWAASVGLLGPALPGKSRSLLVCLFSGAFSCVSSSQAFSSVAESLLLVPGEMVENGSFHLRNFTLATAKNGGWRWWGNAVELPHHQPTSQTHAGIPESPLANTTNSGCKTVCENVDWVLY